MNYSEDNNINMKYSNHNESKDTLQEIMRGDAAGTPPEPDNKETMQPGRFFSSEAMQELHNIQFRMVAEEKSREKYEGRGLPPHLQERILDVVLREYPIVRITLGGKKPPENQALYIYIPWLYVYILDETHVEQDGRPSVTIHGLLGEALMGGHHTDRQKNALWSKLKERIPVVDKTKEPEARYISLANGIYDLETQTLIDKPTRQTRFFTQLATSFNPNVGIDTPSGEKTGTLRQWLLRQFGEEQTEAILDFAASTLYRDSSRFSRNVVILMGEPKTGKSILLQIIEQMLGNQKRPGIGTTVSHVRFNELVRKDRGQQQFNLGELAGTYLNTYSELSKEPIGDTSFLKAITDGGSVTLTKKNVQQFPCTLWTKFLFAANLTGDALPRLPAGDTAFLDRLHPILCEVPSEDTDGAIMRELTQDHVLEGLLTECLTRLYEIVYGGRAVTVSSTGLESEGMRQWRLFSVPAQVFLEDCLVFPEESYGDSDEDANRAYENKDAFDIDHAMSLFTAWAEREGVRTDEKNNPVTVQELGTALSASGIRKKQLRIDGRRTRIYYGARLQLPDDADASQEKEEAPDGGLW